MCRSEQRHLLLSTAERGSERRRCPLMANANEILVLTRENVPGRTLYFLQHRWRLWDYVRTPLGPLTWGNAARKSRLGRNWGARRSGPRPALEVMGVCSNPPCESNS